jgi:hypothetical protein
VKTAEILCALRHFEPNLDQRKKLFEARERGASPSVWEATDVELVLPSRGPRAPNAVQLFLKYVREATEGVTWVAPGDFRSEHWSCCCTPAASRKNETCTSVFPGLVAATRGQPTLASFRSSKAPGGCALRPRRFHQAPSCSPRGPARRLEPTSSSAEAAPRDLRHSRGRAPRSRCCRTAPECVARFPTAARRRSCRGRRSRFRRQAQIGRDGSPIRARRGRLRARV